MNNMPKKELKAVGECEKCGAVVIRPLSCSHGVCPDCNSPTLVKLKPALVEHLKFRR